MVRIPAPHGVRQAGWFFKPAAALLIGLLLIASAAADVRKQFAEAPPKNSPASSSSKWSPTTWNARSRPALKATSNNTSTAATSCREYVRQIGLTIRALQQADLQLTPRQQAAAPDR
jgi:hypothetical protein